MENIISEMIEEVKDLSKESNKLKETISTLEEEMAKRKANKNQQPTDQNQPKE